MSGCTHPVSLNSRVTTHFSSLLPFKGATILLLMQSNFKWPNQEKKEGEKFKIWQYVEYMWYPEYHIKT